MREIMSPTRIVSKNRCGSRKSLRWYAMIRTASIFCPVMMARSDCCQVIKIRKARMISIATPIRLSSFPVSLDDDVVHELFDIDRGR